MSKDYYKILNVSKTATEEEIKKAFRKLAHEHHPDKTNGNADKFKEINEAYQVLGNKEKRAQYDQFGSTFAGGGFGNGFGGQGFGGFGQGGQGSYNINMDDLGDILGGFGDMFGFGGGRRSGRSRAKRGRDLEMGLQLDWEEAIFGAKKTIKLEKLVNCAHCSGAGAEPGTKVETCATCHGSGHVTRIQRTILGNMQMQTTCEVCSGSGKIIEQKCSKCRGRGVTNEKVELAVNIPAGIDDNETIRLSGQGEVPEASFGTSGSQGGASGDLYLRIRVRTNKDFERRGYDILTDLPITFSEATLGTKRDIKTIDGEVSLKIPAGTEAEQTFVLKNKGVQRLNGSGRGDHLVTVKIKVPKNLSRQQKKLLEELGGEGL
jgi:molecular chaperone DnaJ